jgi:biopolymer transport protein ExbB/TolQ
MGDTGREEIKYIYIYLLGVSKFLFCIIIKYIFAFYCFQKHKKYFKKNIWKSGKIIQINKKSHRQIDLGQISNKKYVISNN